MTQLKKNSLRPLLTLITLLSFAWSVQAQGQDASPEGRSRGKAIHKTIDSEETRGSAAALNSNNGEHGISYHGGPVILADTRIYYIWYGDWSRNTAPEILQEFAENIGGSPYFNINTTYYNASGVNVSNAVHFAGSTTDSYSRGRFLGDYDILGIVSDAIIQGRLPMDTNGIYFVLTSADVNETSGFCTFYCGWHWVGTVAGQDIKFAFVGNSDRCFGACMAQSVGPNDNAGADGMVNVIAHELEEAVTDPELDAWYDSFGGENADKCAWSFGGTYIAPNGALANMKLGTRDYLIQQNWVNARIGYCALAFPQ